MCPITQEAALQIKIVVVELAGEHQVNTVWVSTRSSRHLDDGSVSYIVVFRRHICVIHFMAVSPSSFSIGVTVVVFRRSYPMGVACSFSDGTAVVFFCGMLSSYPVGIAWLRAVRAEREISL